MKRIVSILKRLWPKSIRFQLILGVILVHLILMTLFVGDLVRRQNNYLIDQNISAARSLSSVLALRCSSDLLDNDLQGLEETLQAHSNIPNFRYAMVLSNENIVMAHTDKKLIGLKIMDSVSLSLKKVPRIQTMVNNSTLLDIAAPVFDGNNNIIGWVRIGTGQESISKSIRMVYWSSFLYILLAVLIGSIMALFISKRLTAELNQLLVVTKEIKHGDREVRVPDSKTYEIAELGTGINQMLNEINANERLLKTVLETLPIGVWITNRKGELTFGNLAAYKIWYGVDQESKGGFPVFKGWHLGTGKQVENYEWTAFNAIKNKASLVNQEFEIECLDKSRLIIINSSLPLIGLNQEIIGTLVIQEDITRSRKIEESLKLQSEIVQQMAEGVVLSGSDNGIIYFTNPPFEKLFGYEPGELIGKHISILNAPTDISPIETAEQILQTLKVDAVWRGEVENIRKDGKRFWCKANISGFNDLRYGQVWISIHEDITANKLAIEKVVQNEERFNLVIQATKDGIWDHDLVNNTFYYSPSWYDILGLPKDGPDLQQGDIEWPKRIHPDHYDYVMNQFRENLLKNKPYELEYLCLHNSGEYRWIRTISKAIFNAAGKPRRIIGTISDITDRKKAEEALRETKEYLENLINYSRALIIVWNPSFKITRFNPAFENFTGFRADEVMGKDLHILFEESTKEATLRKITTIISGNNFDSVEIPILCKDGQVKVALWNSANVLDKMGNTILSTIAQGLDITERKKAESDLRESEEKFSKLFHLSPDAIILTTIENGVIVDVNDRVFDHFGHLREECLDKSTITLKIWADEASRNRYTAIIKERGVVTNFETIFYSKSGEKKFVSLSGELIYLKGKQLIFSVIHDITESKMAQLEVLKMSRIYHLTSLVNQLVLRSADPGEIFSELCRIAIEQGKFRMVWIGIYDAQIDKLTPVNWYGHEDGYLDSINISGREIHPEGMGPIGRSIRLLKAVYCNDIATDPSMAYWRDAALKRGYHSSVSIPILVNKQVYGIMTIYADESYFFNSSELKMLDEVVGNISFALDNIRKEELRKQAEENATALNLQLQESLKNITDYKYAIDQGSIVSAADIYGNIVYVNENFIKITKYAEKELIGYNHRMLNSGYHPAAYFKTLWDTILGGKVWHGEIRNRAKDRSVFWTYNTIVPFLDKDGNPFYFLSLITDITQRKHAEMHLIDSLDQLRQLASHLQEVREEERQLIAREIHDELGQQLTGLKMDVAFLLYKIPPTATAAKESINKTLGLIDATIKTVRRISTELRPNLLDDLGLIDALQWQCQEFEKRSGVDTGFYTNLTALKLPANIAIVMFRVCQESLTNIMRYAEAKKVKVNLKKRQQNLVLKITDDGKGFDLEAVKAKKTLGLVGIKERALTVNGELKIQTAPGEGTVVEITIPLN